MPTRKDYCQMAENGSLRFRSHKPSDAPAEGAVIAGLSAIFAGCAAICAHAAAVTPAQGTENLPALAAAFVHAALSIVTANAALERHRRGAFTGFAIAATLGASAIMAQNAQTPGDAETPRITREIQP